MQEFCFTILLKSVAGNEILLIALDGHREAKNQEVFDSLLRAHWETLTQKVKATDILPGLVQRDSIT